MVTWPIVRYNHRIKLGYGDIARTLAAIKAWKASASRTGNLTAKTFRFKAARFLRWRRKRRMKT
jgi:hypothetical protein